MLCPGGDIYNITKSSFHDFHLQAKCHYSKYPIHRLWCIFCYIPFSNNLSLQIMMHIYLHCSKIWIVRLYILPLDELLILSASHSFMKFLWQNLLFSYSHTENSPKVVAVFFKCLIAYITLLIKGRIGVIYLLQLVS